jgi:hypothetical protein
LKELARAEKLSLQFLKADVVLPLDESSDEDACHKQIKGFVGFVLV